MTGAPVIEAQRLAGLVASRICHDLISPIGALGNGLELVRAEGQAGEEELALIEDCANAASATLAFHRIAFGAAAPSDRFDLDEAARAARAFFAPRRILCDWSGRGGDAAKTEAKALMLGLLNAAELLPRGGRIAAAPNKPLGWVAEGALSPRTDEIIDRIASGAAPEAPAPGEIHAVILPMLAREMGRRPYARRRPGADGDVVEIGLA